MQMIRHIVDGDQFLFLTGNDAGDIFLQFVVMFRSDEILPAFDGEHDMNINLRIGVGHAPKTPLLTELENPFSFDSTKMSRLRRLIRMIRSERCAIMRFVFNRCDVMKSGHFQVESLATTTSTQFNCR
jgi:hypothetical protein